MKNLNNLLKHLLENNIDFVLVGGFASTLYGSTMVTRDIDICYAMTPQNIENLRTLLKDLHPVHRQTPNKISFIELPKELKGINNLYLDTDLGTLDILSQITGVGDYERVKSKAIEVNVFGHKCKVISLDDLISAKKTLGRNKDLLVVQELEEIKKKQNR
jgi:predicted nucleotidyltransferase